LVAEEERDQEGWHLKEALCAADQPAAGTKLFRSMPLQAYVDTLTLYLHGLCCDIDVEAGPRQLPSRNLRKRLSLLEDAFPPPATLSFRAGHESSQQLSQKALAASAAVADFARGSDATGQPAWQVSSHPGGASAAAGAS
jgi:hypothetical protein